MPGPPPVREILVDAILWWCEGRPNAEPGLSLRRFTEAERDHLYQLVDDAAFEVGQSHVEWVMEHLAQVGGAYLTADGQIVEANRPTNTPNIPARLLEEARRLHTQAAQAA